MERFLHKRSTIKETSTPLMIKPSQIKISDIDPGLVVFANQSSMEKKAHHREFLKQYTLRRENAASTSTAVEAGEIQPTNGEQYSHAIAATKQKDLENENVLDSKPSFDVRPQINNTIEKRKFSAYANPETQIKTTQDQTALSNFIKKCAMEYRFTHAWQDAQTDQDSTQQDPEQTVLHNAKITLYPHQRNRPSDSKAN